MPMPKKVNPSLHFDDSKLRVLNGFLDYLLGLLNDKSLAKAAQDAIKVVDCLRFIAMNEDFIRYSFENKNDANVYTFTRDKDNGVLRDFNNTSFHLNSYQNIATCIRDLRNLIAQFEWAIGVCQRHNQLVEFVKSIRYDDDVGCLETRISKSLQYAAQMQSGIVLNFENLMSQVQTEFTAVDEHDYEKLFTFFKAYLGQKALHGSQEITLTTDYLINYMINTLYYEAPKIISLNEEKTAAPPAQKHPLQLITEWNAVGKIIMFPSNNSTDLNFILNQLIAPETDRPTKKLSASANRTIRYNPKTKQKERCTPNVVRGAVKLGTKFTKKEAVSLLPYPPKMSFYHHDKPEAIGLLFDVTKLHLKGGKYIWKTNVYSNGRWWIEGNQGNEKLMPSVTLDELRQYLKTEIEAKGTIARSEQLFGLCKEALSAVFAHRNELFTRLNALRAQMAINNLLGINLPILIITTDGTCLEYTEELCLDDLQKAQEEDTTIKALINAFGMNVTKIREQVRQNHLNTNKNRQDLLLAITNKDQASALRLLELGVNPNFKKPSTNDTMLQLAIAQGLDKAADKMLDMSLDLDTLTSTILFIMSQTADLYLPYLYPFNLKVLDL